MWEAATRWEFKAAAHGKGSWRLLNGEALAGRSPSPSAAKRGGLSSTRRPDGPGAAGGQIASPTNKLRLVEETVGSLGDQRTRGAAAAPGSEPRLLQLLAATRQTGLCRS